MTGYGFLLGIVIVIAGIAWASHPFRERKEERLSPTWKPGGRDGK